MSSEPLAHSARAFPAARLRPARGMRFAVGMLAFLAALVAGICVAVPELRVVMGIFGAALVVPMGVGLLRLRKHSAQGGAELEVREDGLYVQGRLTMPRETLVRAVVTSDERGVTVVIERRQGFVSIVDVSGVDEGRALVQALGLDASQALSSFTFDSLLSGRLPIWGVYLYIALLVPLMLPTLFFGAAWISLPLVLTWYVALLGGALPARLTIGLDGVLVRWLWRRELIRFEELRAIDHDGEQLHLTLADGRKRSLSVKQMGARVRKASGLPTGFGSKGAYLDAVVARVREALGASPSHDHPAAAALLRQGRELGAWVRALRGVLDRGAAGFREPETLPEQLWSTVEDGSAAPATRAAAAIALGPSLDDTERQRLRGVARVVVSPRLRIALEAAAGDDDDGVCEALAELERGPADRRPG